MKVTVFCGSAFGTSRLYRSKAVDLGRALAGGGHELVYGGSNSGLMGAIADAVLVHEGKVTGVMPHALKDQEIQHTDLSELILVEDMHERKATMAELADAFVAMPGGIGTLEEFFEVWAWAQLGHHQKPCALFNVDGYFDALLQFVDKVVANDFLRPEYRDMLIVNDEPEALLAAFDAYQAPAPKWG